MWLITARRSTQLLQSLRSPPSYVSTVSRPYLNYEGDYPVKPRVRESPSISKYYPKAKAKRGQTTVYHKSVETSGRMTKVTKEQYDVGERAAKNLFAPECCARYNLAEYCTQLVKLGAHDRQLLDRYAERALEIDLSVKDYIIVLSALNKARHLHRGLLDYVASRVPPKLQLCTPQQLSALCNAYARFDVYDKRLFRALSEEIPSKLPYFAPIHIANVLASYVKLKIDDFALFDDIYDHLQRCDLMEVAIADLCALVVSAFNISAMGRSETQPFRYEIRKTYWKQLQDAVWTNIEDAQSSSLLSIAFASQRAQRGGLTLSEEVKDYTCKYLLDNIHTLYSADLRMIIRIIDMFPSPPRVYELLAERLGQLEASTTDTVQLIGVSVAAIKSCGDQERPLLVPLLQRFLTMGAKRLKESTCTKQEIRSMTKAVCELPEAPGEPSVINSLIHKTIDEGTVHAEEIDSTRRFASSQLLSFATLNVVSTDLLDALIPLIRLELATELPVKRLLVILRILRKWTLENNSDLRFSSFLEEAFRYVKENVSSTSVSLEAAVHEAGSWERIAPMHLSSLIADVMKMCDTQVHKEVASHSSDNAEPLPSNNSLT